MEKGASVNLKTKGTKIKLNASFKYITNSDKSNKLDDITSNKFQRLAYEAVYAPCSGTINTNKATPNI